ncbi:MAG: glycosyltransferase [Bacteriovorax sp.]
MENGPKISVIMPVYLRNEYLLPAIASILNQSFKEFEFIIVANNCSDELWNDLLEIKEKFKDERIRLFRTLIGQISFNLNYAVNESRSELMARMDADDISHPERLQTQYDFMLQNSNVAVVGSCIDIINKEGKKISSQSRPMADKAIRNSLPFKNPFCHPSVMFRKSAFVKHSGYLGGRYSEDYYLWLRMARDKDIVFGNIQRPLLQYRLSDIQTRGLRWAYAEVAGLLWAEFLFQFKFKYFVGAVYSSLKIFRSRK